MKRILIFLIGCMVAISAMSQVTIDARDLKLYESMAGFPFYILRMEASSSTAAIRIEVHVTAEDYTGTYTIGGNNSDIGYGNNKTAPFLGLPGKKTNHVAQPSKCIMVYEFGSDTMQFIAKGSITDYEYMPAHSPKDLGYNVLFTDGHASMIHLDKTGTSRFSWHLNVVTIASKNDWLKSGTIHYSDSYSWIPEIR